MEEPGLPDCHIAARKSGADRDGKENQKEPSRPREQQRHDSPLPSLLKKMCERAAAQNASPHETNIGIKANLARDQRGSAAEPDDPAAETTSRTANWSRLSRRVEVVIAEADTRLEAKKVKPAWRLVSAL